MATRQHHLLLAVVVLSASVLQAAAAASNCTVYDILAENRLPRGLLPQGVQSYEVHVGGALDVTLPGDDVCTVSVAADGKTYRFRYGRCIGGVLDVNPSAITRTYGITMELGSTWLDVSDVRCLGDQVRFEVPAGVPAVPSRHRIRPEAPLQLTN